MRRLIEMLRKPLLYGAFAALGEIAMILLPGLHAEAQNDPGAFFKKDFVNKTKSPVPIIAKTKETTQKDNINVGPAKTQAKKSLAPTVTSEETAEIDRESAKEIEKRLKEMRDNNFRVMAEVERIKGDASKREGSTGVSVESISAIVNPVRDDKFLSQINSLLAVAAAFNIDIGTVYAPGSYMLITPDQQFFLDLYRGKFSAEKKLPEVYRGIRSSPAWIVTTEYGSIIFERFKDVESKFNLRGELIDAEAVNQLRKKVAQNSDTAVEEP